ncbi:MAG TPA: sel1 repeat family protein [Gammaproteobacteria bacterium]|nr:sel1 repeat family protein [Gammaproteobacteria bacterium]
MKFYHFIKYVLMIVLLIAVSGSMNAAMAYGLSGNVLKFQQRLAKKGDPYAQYRLGVMYESGFGVDVDYDEALMWYIKASRQGNRAATRRINYIDILKGGYKPEEDAAWLAELKQDANAGDGEATLLLGVMYKKGIAVDKNLNMSHRYLKRAVVKDVSGAEDELTEVKELMETWKEQEQKKLDAENENRLAEEALLREKKAAARKKAEAKQRSLNRERRKQQLAKKEEKAQRNKKRVVVLRAANANTLAQKKTDNTVELQTSSVEAGKGLSWAEAVELERKKQEADK